MIKSRPLIAEPVGVPFQIVSEEGLIEALEIVEENQEEGVQYLLEEGFEFDRWPTYEVIIRGESFDGGIPTRILPPFLDLQKVLRRAYARSVYGDETKRLTQEERQQTEIVIRLEPGSTKFLSELWQTLNTMAGNMSGPESVAAILGVAVIVGLTIVGKSYIVSRAQAKAYDLGITMSKEETRRLELLASLLRQSPTIAQHIEDAENAQDHLMRKLAPGDELVLDDETSINGQDAKIIARNPRRARVHTREDGRFIIQAVESGQVQRGFRARVRRVDANGGQTLVVSIPEGALPPEQMAELKEGEWGKTPLLMSIDVQTLGDRVVQADLIRARLPRS